MMSHFPTGGFTISLPEKVYQLGQIHQFLRTQDIHLSVRKTKSLHEHGWIDSKGMVIPWGYFKPRPHVIYEDDAVIAVNKPPFMAVLGSERQHITVHRWLEGLKDDRLYGVHRLDYETSGCVTFVKNLETYRQIREQFAQRRVKKTYFVWIYGQPSQAEWVCRGYLKKMPRKSIVCPQGYGALYAETRFQRLVHAKVWDQEICLLRALPRTGRYHQIRAQLYAQGHKVIGDPQYGERCVFRRKGVRLMLHAASLEFTLDQKLVRIEATCPSDFPQEHSLLGD